MRHLIGSTPQATVFQASLCLVIDNVLEVLRALIAASRPEQVERRELSLGAIFGDVREELVSLHCVLSAEEVSVSFEEELSAEELLDRVCACVVKAWSAKWRKATPKMPRVYKTGGVVERLGAHTSVHRVLLETRQRKKLKRPAASSG